MIKTVYIFALAIATALCAPKFDCIDDLKLGAPARLNSWVSPSPWSYNYGYDDSYNQPLNYYNLQRLSNQYMNYGANAFIRPENPLSATYRPWAYAFSVQDINDLYKFKNNVATPSALSSYYNYWPLEYNFVRNSGLLKPKIEEALVKPVEKKVTWEPSPSYGYSYSTVNVEVPTNLYDEVNTYPIKFLKENIVKEDLEKKLANSFAESKIEMLKKDC